MKMRLLLLAALALALCSSVSAVEKHVRRHKQREHSADTTHTQDPAVAAMLAAAEMERDAERSYQERQNSRTKDLQDQIEDGTNEVFVDACSLVHCSAGRVCELSEDGDASCVCIKDCPYETESRRKVCTNHNETWASDCLMYQHRCQCMEGSELCKGPEYHHVQIEYYGQCRDMPECTENEMSDFPRRMRDWLFNVMRDLADRRELSPHYLKMQREAENNLTRRWTNAAIWKWCDLDAHDNDRFVSRHELFPIRAPLMALEHCIAPFLNSCDTNDDHRITLAEWGQCLGLEEFDLEERCDEILEGNPA